MVNGKKPGFVSYVEETCNSDDSSGSNFPELLSRGGDSISGFEHYDWNDSSSDNDFQ